MKRIIGGLLAVALILTLPACARGETILYAQGEGWPELGSTDALWARDGALYAFFSREVARCGTWRPGDAALELRECAGLLLDRAENEMFVPGDDGMWALLNDGGRMTLAPILFEDGIARAGEGVALDWPEGLERRHHLYPSPAVSDGKFAFIYEDDEFHGSLIATFDVRTGRFRGYDEDADGFDFNARALCPYKDGTFLVAMVVHAKNDMRVEFCVLDPLLGELAPLFSVSTIDPDLLGALMYDEAADQLYFVMYYFSAAATLIRITGTDPTTAEELADASLFLDPVGALVGDGVVALADWSSVRVYDANADLREWSGGRLTIAAAGNERVKGAYDRFVRLNPDVNVKLSNAFFNPGDIGTALLTQSEQYDIYVANVGGRDYAALYDRGYLTELSGSEALSEFVAGMYPAMREVVEQDGAPVAIPVAYAAGMPAYNPEAFAALGLTEADVPETWPEFLRLLQRVPELVEGTDCAAFNQYISEDGAARMVLHEMIAAYQLHLECDPSAGMRFDTEILRALLEEYEKIDFTRLGAAEMARDESIVTDEETMLFQFDAWANCEAFYAWDARRTRYVAFMPLALAEGMEPLIRGEMAVAFVNPYSQNRGAAIRYLEAAAAGMPGEMRANLLSGWTEPVKVETADEHLARYDADIAALEAEVEKASGGDKETYQEQLDAEREDRQWFLDAWYWMVPADSLARYQSRAGDIRIWRHFGLDATGEGELSDLLARYLDGAIGADELLENIDRKINMMLLEE